MNILVAAIRAKNQSKSSGLNGHQNQMMNNYKPQFVLYDVSFNFNLVYIQLN